MKRKLLAGLTTGLVIMLGGNEPSNAAIMSVTDETSWQSTVGSWGMADFEGFTGLITTQYAGVTFGGYNGGVPGTTDFFSYQGQHGMFTVEPWNSGGGGGWSASFNMPVQSFAFWSGDVEFSGSTISIFDSASALLGTYDLMGSGGGHGPYLYGFNGFVSDSMDIARVAVTINGADAIWFDNFQYSPASQAPVPEPTTMLLFGTGIAGLAGTRFRRKKQ